MQVAAVILAAGASSRFRDRKHEVRIAGRTMPAHVATAASAAGLSPVLVVAPTGAGVPPGALLVPNDDPASGISRSLALGLRSVPEHVGGAVVLLGDEPRVGADAILEVLVAASDGASLVATAWGDRLGPPVLLRRERFGLRDLATGDAGLGSLLRTQPGLVTVSATRAPIDVDTAADLDAAAPACGGCGARYFRGDEGGAIHEYMTSSPECWSAFSAVMAREFSQPGYGALHRHTVDAFAVQHPGADERRERQSVAVHLIGLCHWLEHGLAADQMTPITQRLTAEPADWPRLAVPPPFEFTVADLLPVASADEHLAVVRDWATAAWAAYAAFHPLVRAWAERALAGQRVP